MLKHNLPSAQQSEPSLPELSIGPVRIGFPVVQAALSGYSDWPMRVVARRLGASYTVGEVLLDQFIVNVSKGPKVKRFIHVSDEEHPCGAQLMGAEPEQFAAAAVRLAAAGFDVIDINFGCPVRKVLGKCRGGYLLSTPETAVEIVGRVRDAVPPHIPVTVKMRRGMDDTAESRAAVFSIFDGALARGAAAITVHGRTVRQRYQGRSSWEFLAEVKRHAPQSTVLGSGDLFTARDCLAMIARTGVNGVAVARGAIGNPWIFGQVRALAAGLPLPLPPTVHQQREVLAAHFRLAESLYGTARCCGPMCKFGIKYSRMHPQSVPVRDAFAAARRPADWWQVLSGWYADDGPGRTPDCDEASCQQEDR